MDSGALIVGIEEQRIAIICLRDRLERLLFSLEHLDERVRNGPRRGKPILVGRVEQRGAGAATDIGRARDGHWLLGAPESKL